MKTPTITAICLTGFLALGGQTVQAKSIDLKYRVFVGGLETGEVKMQINHGKDTYHVKSEIRSLGLVDVLIKFRSSSFSRGRVTNNIVSPLQHEAHNMWRGDPRSVVMKYNEKDEVFWYWADSNIEYKNLETVARKYIKTFNCKNIYIDRKTTLENDKKERARQEEITKKKIEEWKTKQDEEEESVFAKLKTPQEKRSARKESSAPSKANKYTRKGKLEEMSLFQPLLNRDKQKKKIKNEVSWGDWFQINKTKED